MRAIFSEKLVSNCPVEEFLWRSGLVGRKRFAFLANGIKCSSGNFFPWGRLVVKVIMFVAVSCDRCGNTALIWGGVGSNRGEIQLRSYQSREIVWSCLGWSNSLSISVWSLWLFWGLLGVFILLYSGCIMFRFGENWHGLKYVNLTFLITSPIHTTLMADVELCH